jgi:hypothetical protein
MQRSLLHKSAWQSQIGRSIWIMGRKGEAFNRGLRKSRHVSETCAGGHWLSYLLPWEYKDDGLLVIGEFSCPQKYWS